MTHLASLRRLPSVLLCCLAVCAVACAPAWASSSYGEVGHFGGGAKFNIAEPSTQAFGVDSTDNSVFVGDGPTSKHEYRIQKFTCESSGNCTLAATASFKPPRPQGLEGIAVDPGEKRVYALALQIRGEGAEFDAEVEAAGSLYALSSETLKPAKNAKGEELPEGGVLAGPTVLKPQGAKAGESLLEPSGIAVDPTTHDVVLMGTQDVGEEVHRVALQRVHADGTLGPRWLDEGDFFESEEATSPAVSPAGKVYVIGGGIEVGGELVEEIDEIPSNFEAKSPPVAAVQFHSGFELVTFPGVPPPNEGGGLSIAPDGRFWVYGKVTTELEGKRTKNPGALAFSATGQELGWTGGQSKALGLGHCTVSFLGHPQVAAGSEERVFMFDSNPEAPNVVEFGPGGSGCPEGSATPPAATVKGAPVNPVPAGVNVTLSSTVSEADALSVKWNFGDGTEAENNKVQYQTTEITHVFTKEGEFPVTETIHSDNLATPTVVVEKKLTVKASPPTPQFNGPLSVGVGEAATFDAKNSAANGSPITKYLWNFGDGTETSTESSAIAHAFAAPGIFTVSLREINKAGTSESVAHAITVSQPGGGGGGGGGGGTGGGAGGGNSGGQTGGTGGGTAGGGAGGGGGVLAYSASLAGTSLSVNPAGAVVLKVDCAGASSCAGTVTLRTLKAVSAGGKKKAILTLASGSFSAAPHQIKLVTLHLSAKARALLAKSHTLRVLAMIVGRDSAGNSHTAKVTVTLKAAKAHKH